MFAKCTNVIILSVAIGDSRLAGKDLNHRNCEEL